MHSTAAHASHATRLLLRGPVERVFPLFEPEGERNWAPGWDPRFLWPADHAARAGATFLTDDGERVWVIAEHEPGHRIVYVNLRPGMLATRVEVRCAAEDGATRAEVRYDVTALAAEVDSPLLHLDQAAYAALIAEWETAINAWLRGEPVPPPSL